MRTISEPFLSEKAIPPDDFRELFQRHYPQVRRRAASILGDQHAAEDIAQETFCRLLFNPPVHRSNLPAWLARVATNLSLNRIRGEKNRARRESVTVVQKGMSVDSAEEGALSAVQVALVQQALAVVPVRQRQCLLLRYAGLSYAEVAAAVGVAPGSVGKLLARGEDRFGREFVRLNGGIADVF